MALTVTTDLTVLTTAETVTGWTSIGSQSAVLEPDFFAQGSNAISRAVSNTTKGMAFDAGTARNFTAGADQDKLVYIWMRCNTPSLSATIASAGITVRLCTTSATAAYREWYVDGSDTIQANDGWICYVVDPQSAGSVADTGAYSAASVRFFGGTMSAITTAKGQNFGIDQISIGRGELRVTGTVTNAGQGMKEIADEDWGDVATGRFGIISIKAGIYYVRGKIVIGNATTATTWSSRGETVVFESPHVRSTTAIVRSIPNASVGGTLGSDGKSSYVGLGFIGGTAATSIDIGVIVGTDSGRSGSTFIVQENQLLTTPARSLATVTVSDATMSLSLYAATFLGFEGQIDLTGTGVAGDDVFGTTFNGCGRVDSNMEMRNVNILNSVAIATDGAFLWNSSADIQKSLFANNSRAIVIENSVGAPYTFTSLTFANNTFDVRNESTGANITINVAGIGNTPSTEDVATSVTTVVAGLKTLTLTGLITGSDIVINTTGTVTQILDIDQNVGSTYAYSYTYVPSTFVDIKIMKAGYVPYQVYNFNLANGDAALPIAQTIDRTYV